MIFRRRFADLVGRQLDLFEREEAELLRDSEAAKRAYDAAGRDEAEARYSAYLDLIELGTDRLAELRDAYAAALEEDAAAEYEAAFDRGVRKRLPRFALEA